MTPKSISDAMLRPRLGLLIAFALWQAAYFAIYSEPMVIFQSMAEAAAWGKEFQFGYNQHPPFWAWIAGLWFLVFPHTNGSYSLLSAVNCAIGLAGAWALIGRFAKDAERIAATVLLLATPLYTFGGYGFNANIIFVSVWPWTLYAFVSAYRSRRAWDAAAFGLMMGVALLSKYYALILGATCFLAAVRHPSRRAYFTSASPYISIAVAGVVIAPHVVWLIANGAPPLRYFGEVSHLGPLTALRNVFATLLGSLAENALAVGLVVYASGWRPSRIRTALAEPETQVLAILALAPLALSLAASLALQSKLVTPMLQGTFPLVPLFAMRALGAEPERLTRLAKRVAAVVLVAELALAPLQGLFLVWFTTRPIVAVPIRELAAQATALWREKTGLPLSYVGGSYALGDAVSFYSPDHPHSFESLDYRRRLWVTPEALAAHGLLSLCVAADSRCLADTARFATPQSSRVELTIAREVWGRRFPPVKFVATVIPPHA